MWLEARPLLHSPPGVWGSGAGWRPIHPEPFAQEQVPFFLLAHQLSMATIAGQMSIPHALELLEKSNLTGDALSLITDVAQHKQLRRQPKGHRWAIMIYDMVQLLVIDALWISRLA